MKTRIFVGCVLLIAGVTWQAYDAKALLGSFGRDSFNSQRLLTSISDLWIAVHPTSIANLWAAIHPTTLTTLREVANEATPPIAISLFQLFVRMPIASLLIFAGIFVMLVTLFCGRSTKTVLNGGSTSYHNSQRWVQRADGPITKSQVPHDVMRSRLTSADREFLPAALEIIETPTSPIVVAMIWFTCLAFSSALAWSYFGQLDIYAVASGKIQPSGRSKVVQPFETGKVVAVHVENGSFVKAGDVLIELDPTETSADREVQARELEATGAEVIRRKAAVAIAQSGELMPRPMPLDSNTSELVRDREQGMLSADIGQLSSAINSLKAQLAELTAQYEGVTMTIGARTKLIGVLKERVDTRDLLDAQGQGFRSKVIDALQEYERENTNLVGDQGQLIEFDAKKRSINSKIEETLAQFIRDQMDKLGEAEQKKDRLEQELIKANTKNERTRLTAPISGVVQQLAVTTMGQVVASGQALMTVVPQDAPMEIEAMIQNQDVGFVDVGQPVTIKVDAFPFTRYGTLEGTVVNISRDGVDQKTSTNLSDAASLTKPQGAATSSSSNISAETLGFPAKIAISRQTILVDGKVVRLMPGMAVTAEIKTGQRRAIDYVLSPLREIQAASLQER